MKKNVSSFSQTSTNIVKGIAVILLIIHHMMFANPGLPIELKWQNISALVGSAGKVCVAAFMILSGYGLTISIKKSKQNKFIFAFNHIIKLWLAFLICYFVSCILFVLQGNSLIDVYSQNGNTFICFLKDFLGLNNFVKVTPSINGTWWYMEAAYVCYLLFPLIYYLVRKSKITSTLLLVISYFPWIYYQFKHDFNMHTDRELFYIFPFVLGIVLSEYNVFNRIKELSDKHKFVSVVLSSVLFGVCFIIRSQLCLIFDSFFALSIVIISICFIEKIPFISNIAACFGKYSSNIYMTHFLIIPYLNFFPFENIWIRILLLSILSLILSVSIEGFKKESNYIKLCSKMQIK